MKKTKMQKEADTLIMKLEDHIWEIVREDVLAKHGDDGENLSNEYMLECVKEHQAMKTYVAQLILMRDQRE